MSQRIGSISEFTSRFIIPIKSGQTKDCSNQDLKKMKQRSFLLNKKLKSIVDRKDIEQLTQDLKPKRGFHFSVLCLEYL